MFLYSMGLITEFAAFLYLKFKHPEMDRPYVFPLGKRGAVLGSVPIILICLFQMIVTDMRYDNQSIN